MSAVYFPRVIRDSGQAGVEPTTLEATEGAAGNISAFVRALRNLDEGFVPRDELTLPAPAPELTAAWVVVTGTGRRLRDVRADPEQSVAVRRVHDDSVRATCDAAADLRPTGAWKSHLAIHADQVGRRDPDYHAVVHAQPHHLIYLSHYPAYARTYLLNDRLLRWEPETVVTFPEGIGLIPFQTPGSDARRRETVGGLRDHRLVMWQKHGVVARSDGRVAGGRPGGVRGDGGARRGAQPAVGGPTGAHGRGSPGRVRGVPRPPTGLRSPVPQNPHPPLLPAQEQGSHDDHHATCRRSPPKEGAPGVRPRGRWSKHIVSLIVDSKCEEAP